MSKSSLKSLIGIAFIITSYLLTVILDYKLYVNLIPESQKHFILTWSIKRIMPFLIFVSMFLGIFSGRVVEQLQKSIGPVNILNTFVSTLKSSRFWIAMFCTPMIYYGLWLLMKKVSDPLLMLILSYQNGFFWNGITGAIKFNENSN